MKLTFKTFFIGVYLLLLLSIFLFGGSIQFFLGFSATLYSLSILLTILTVIFIYTLAYQKIYFNNLFFIVFIYLGVVFVSGFLNESDLEKIFLYCIFPLTPFSVFYLYKMMDANKINIKKITLQFFKFISLIQLPVALIQNYGYDFLIKFNNSSQTINDYDFMFGTFFIRADHALGFFLIINILYHFGITISGIKGKFNWFYIIYLSITIFVLESNLSKLILVLLFLYYLFFWLYKKANVLSLILIGIVSAISIKLLFLVPSVDAQYFYFKNLYTPELSERYVNEGPLYAKRPHILIDFVVNKPVEWIGHGPYDYFNIVTSKFKNTKHFSQMIWAYNDLGLLGFLLIILLLYQILISLRLAKKEFRILFIMSLFFLFMTNMYSDLAMMFSFILLKAGNFTSFNENTHY